ncbi:arylsulfatase [Aestuariimicrobium sp. T2.26MG-19.2B]|uniref:arylsulfatase n=1 Tax=Aestuariimicrobium sp. T2.26MG-19.2B TaxID=3040679 RepID=UPI002477A90F|nr:arylsulfatase [Aestuariimicrobium sp. T2.26MG-19.2B]CAI9406732.1 Arylsulfatase [Aestuariimicrobium sp. T2.26MG-19.2B]
MRAEPADPRPTSPEPVGADQRPNIILICVDQMRGDTMSSAGHPVVQTPNLDELVATGTAFSSAYSATPTCVPARVALFTGQSQERHGRYGYREGVRFQEAHPVTLQGTLREAGYQTQAIGKMHVWPERARCGFDNVLLHDGFLHFARGRHPRHEDNDDYLTWLRRQPGLAAADIDDHGVGCNDVVGRPFDKDERVHPSTWAMTEAVDFLKRRDPTSPFFLYLSFHRPHGPFDPPQWAWDLYRDADVAEPSVGDWEDELPGRRDHRIRAQFGRRSRAVREQVLRGYWGNITHIDLQLNRLHETLTARGLAHNTVICFVSDHGDMMGDHHLYQKAVGYEGSVRVPFVVQVPGGHGAAAGRWRDEVVELRDLAPTLLDLAGVDIPDEMDGRSLVPLLAGAEPQDWRDHLHGEHVINHFGLVEQMHWVTDGSSKFCWFSGSGREQFFDLVDDPGECHDLNDHPSRLAEVDAWRARLVADLSGREEGFVRLTDDGAPELVPGRPISSCASWVPSAAH